MPSPTSTPSPSPSLEVGGTSAPIDASVNDVLDFISAIVSSLAWPLVVLILVLMFKGAISKILVELIARMAKLKRVKAPGGAELEWFDDKVEELVDKAEALPPTAGPGSSSTVTAEEDVALRLVPIDPSSAIVAAFVPVEQAANAYLKARHVKSIGSPMSGLRRDHYLPEDLKTLILDMSRVRNAAAHERPEISEETALSFLKIAASVSDRLRILTHTARPREEDPTPRAADNP